MFSVMYVVGGSSVHGRHRSHRQFFALSMTTAEEDADMPSCDPALAAGRLVRGEAGGCHLCLYRWSSPNPVKRRSDKQPLLPRKSSRSNCCGVCAGGVVVVVVMVVVVVLVVVEE